MQIHIVEQGETVYGIANLYGVVPNVLIEANELEQPGDLVVGQSLVIPIIGQFYFVQPGDTLYSIAQNFAISYQQLAQINNISPDASLQIGLRLYIPPQPKKEAAFNAYIEPLGESVKPTLVAAAEKNTPYLSYLAPFSYKVNRDGSLNAPALNNFKQIAETNNAALMMVVTNLEEGQFSKELGRIIVTDTSFQDTLLNNIVKAANQIGAGDVHFDLEFLPPETRENYNNFLRKAYKRLSNEGFLVSTALAPKTSAEQEGAWYEAHDYKAHGEIVDFVVLMTYEWGYSGGPPLPVSPIGPVREVVNFAKSVMPSEKIFLGQNLYGYDWTLPYEAGGEFAKALSPQQAIALAAKENVAIQYDEEAQAPFFFYSDNAGLRHEVWFEDARSIQAKFDLVKELNLKGVSYWKLGLAFPQNWLLIQDQFDVEKKS